MPAPLLFFPLLDVDNQVFNARLKPAFVKSVTTPVWNYDETARIGFSVIHFLVTR